MKPYLGMYVHMHWGYNYPYAARTWSLEDWRGYAGALAALGYNMIMIWPMFETMPDTLTPSDHAHLDKIRQVVDMLHSELGMAALITMSPNTVGSENATQYAFEDRPYFKTELRLDPGDPDQLDRLICSRRKIFEYLGMADGFSIIDGDPGGYIGSTNNEFVELLWRHLDLIKEFHPTARLYYWMWTGWETYNKMWQDAEEHGGSPEIEVKSYDFEVTLNSMLKRPDDNWGLLANREVHFEVIEKLGLGDRAIFNPYNLVETEPTFPLTNHHPQLIFDELSRNKPPKLRLGIMANAQSHIVQLPNTYYFAHFAEGGTMADADLNGFAEGLLTGSGALIAEAWKTIRTDESEHMRSVAKKIGELKNGELRIDKFGGLMLGGPQRFLEDLRLQLAFRADSVDFINTVEMKSDWLPALKALLISWRAWQKRTGFEDAYVDTQNLHPALLKLGDKRIDRVLADFDNWKDPTIRNGILHRLLDAIKSFVDGFC